LGIFKPAQLGIFKSALTFIIAIIILSVFAVIIESVESIYLSIPKYFDYFERFSVLVFTIEYILRVYSCTADEKYQSPIIGRLKYVITPFAIIDLLAILPFFIPMLIPLDLRFLRALRLFRILRIFKLARYTNTFQLLIKVLKREKEALTITIFFLFIVLIISSCLMYHAECQAQPILFGSIPDAMWWGVASLTTVGYGDVYPITPIGRLLAGIIAITGIGFVALPTAIISSGFILELQETRDIQSSDIGIQALDTIERLYDLKENGLISEEEFEKKKWVKTLLHISDV